jgi:hypothetical protein
MEFLAMRKSNRGESVSSVSPVKPMFENLEGRLLLSSSLVRGVLKVNGDAGVDNITLSASSTRIIVLEDGAAKSFKIGLVKSIAINTGDGNDHVIINGNPKKPITIKTGNGNDLIHGSAGHDRIYGGNDNDSILGLNGNDYIQGDAGNDTIDGGSGNDYIYGDAGDDSLRGGAGNDVMGGDLENTLVFRDVAARVEGNDRLDGGDGNDWLLSERRLIGIVDGGIPTSSADDKWIFAANGQDTFTGGAGNDIIDIGANEFDSTSNNDTITDEQPGDFVPMRESPTYSEHNPGDVHTHVTLRFRVRSGSGYKNAIVPNDLGHFAPKFLSGLHTHSRPTKQQLPLPPGANLIHYEAPPNSPAYRLSEFFRVAGISFNSAHLGRFLPPAGKKMSLWITRGGRTFQSKAFEKFVPSGHNFPQLGDIVEIRVG